MPIDPALQPGLGPRATSLALVILLHLLVLLALLQMVTKPRMVIGAREIFLRLPQRLRVAPAPFRLPQSRPSRRAPVSRALPTMPAPSGLVPSEPAPDIRGLGQNVFGCAPENLPNLSSEQRSHCHGLTPPDDTLLALPPSHVKDPQRRAAEMRTKNTPGRIPCTMIMEAPAPYGGKAPAPAVDPICVIGGLLNGFGPLNGLPK